MRRSRYADRSRWSAAYRAARAAGKKRRDLRKGLKRDRLFHAVCATGLASEAVKEEFAQHAKEEGEHLDLLIERINQLGGKPDLNPDGVSSRAASEYVEGANLVDMIKENLIAERIAIETYREMVRYFGDKDSTTRVLLERILAQEEQHANDMHDLLVSHEGRPMLEK